MTENRSALGDGWITYQHKQDGAVLLEIRISKAAVLAKLEDEDATVRMLAQMVWAWLEEHVEG